MNGGYTLIDFRENDILDKSLKIDGIYKAVENAFNVGKSIQFVNAKKNSMDSSPITVFACKGDKKYYCTSSTLELVVNEDDTITVRNLVPTGGGK